MRDVQSDPVTTAKDDAVGTLRRISGPGFAHLIRLEQPEDWPCWDLIDVYGSCAELMGYDAGLLTDDEVDALQTVVVYVPADQWE